MRAAPGSPRVSRLYGTVVLLALVALGVGLRDRAERRTERLLGGEATAAARVAELAELLAGTALDELTPTERLAILPRQRGLLELEGAGDDRTAFAEDEAYCYGLGLVDVTDRRTGRRRLGWAVRAWPREFGVTGDLEYYVDERGVVWAGQNPTGRSGTDAAFPPPFPEREIEDADQAVWWRVDA